ncbi:hypothetical protein M8J77_021805 [Diaphorina citri]|nr:hypothetical protein M8J77_021805 [Diaphorina citri]
MCSIVKVTDPKAALLAAQCLKKGCVVALPTDTLYGLACDATNSKAINILYEIKKRDVNKPLAICVSEITDIPKWADTHTVSFELLAELLPGPVTIVFNRSEHLNLELNPNVTKVAVRIPDHKFMRQLLKLMDSPLALTSANESNEPSTLCITEFQKLWSQLSVVIDGGIISNPERFGSTIVDLSEENVYSIVRKGMYSTQPKLPFPQKKKASILKNTKDKMNQILSHDNSTKKMVLHPNEPITTVDEVSRSPRVTRSCSQLPQTPKSQRPNTCRTPTSHQPITPKTPSTLLSDLHLGSPRTPSSLLRSLKLDSPKRKIDTALEFASPKRVFKDADATSSGAASAVDATSTSDAVRSVSGSRSSASDVASRSRSSASDIASPRMKLFAEDKTSLQDSSSKRTRSRNDSPAKPVESPLKISDRLNLCLRRRDSSEANPVAISPLKRLVSSPAKKSDESPLKRSQGRSKSPLKTSSSAKDSPKRSQDKTPIKPNKGFGSSPLKRSQRLESPLKRNSVKLKSSADIENELFDSDLDDSPEKLDSPLKNSGIPLKNPSDNFASPRRSLRLTIDSPKKVGKFNLENISGAARSKNSPQIDRFNLENTAVATRSPLKIDSPRKISAYNSENTLRSPLKRDSSREISKYNSENASVTTRSPMKIDSPRKIDKHNLASIRSPLKTEADCLRPLSPIKNIILDKKSPFKAFIRDDEDLIKRSPAKLCSPRKLLFSEDKPKVEEKAKDSCELPGREVQLEGIRQFLLGHVNNETSGSMYISGPPGTGKSASLNLLVSRAEVVGWGNGGLGRRRRPKKPHSLFGSRAWLACLVAESVVAHFGRVQTFHEQSRSVEEQKKIFSAAQLQGHASEDQHKREKPMFEGWKGRAMTLTP